MGYLNKLRMTMSVKKDALLALIATLLGGVGVLMETWSLTKSNWLIGIVVVVYVLSLIWLLIPIIQSIQAPYTNFWPNAKGARIWLRSWLQGNPIKLIRFGIKNITVIGVAGTDIGDLYEDVVNAVCAGISFRIFVVNPNLPELGPGGILRELEPAQQIASLVQKPLSLKIELLAQKYELVYRNNNTARKLRGLKSQLEKRNFSDHPTAIKVCQAMWVLAEEEAKTRIPNTTGSVEIYYLNELPVIRQWIIDDKALLHSLYTGHPGVGIDNPVFCFSILEGNSYGSGEIGKRAEYYANQLALKHAPPVK